MPEISCGLDRCFLCRHCMPEWREVTAGRKKTLVFKRGKALFSEGEPVKGLYFLYSGVVKIHAPWLDGREMIIRFTREGEIAGHRGLGAVGGSASLGGSASIAAPASLAGSASIAAPASPAGSASPARPAIYPISATALEDTVACFVDNDLLELSLKANPSLVYALMHFFSSDLQKAEKRMRDLTLMEVKGRIAGALLDILADFGTAPDGTLALKLTRQDLAAYAGTTYETVFKFFTELTGSGVIATAGKDITILLPERLTQLASR